jgi:hypothetical protein
VAAQTAGGVVAVVKPWAWENGGGCGLNSVSRGGAVVQTERLTGGPTGYGSFFQFIQNWLNFKNQNGCLILLQKFAIFPCG